MNSRLTRTTPEAFARRLQMSVSAVSLLVEGREDRFFWGGIASAAYSPLGVCYQIYTSSELPTGPGKQGLLKFFDFLESRNGLKTEGATDVRAIGFLLDKDVDDIIGIQRCSAHIIYTRCYCVENDYFCHGNVLRALAAATNTDEALVLKVIGDPAQWMATVAQSWREWVVLCLLASMLGVRCQPTYSVVSQVHDPSGKPISGAVECCLKKLLDHSGLPRSSFELAVEEAEGRVADLFASGCHDKVFSGKWYLDFAKRAFAVEVPCSVRDQKALKERVLSALGATLDFEATWCGDYVRALRVFLGDSPP